MSYIQTIDTDSLTNTSVTREYDLGTRYVDYSSTDGVKSEYIYLRAHTGLSVNMPFQVSLSNVDASAITTKTPSTTTTGAMIVVPQVGVPSGYYFWGQYKGSATVLCTGFATADFAEVINNGTSFILDGGASGSTVESGTTLGIATSSTSGGLATFILSGNRVQVAAA
tara:strand:+ start:12124 stop:12627 length:504 start_codon:yes stop_codon:yes gene_type:complete